MCRGTARGPFAGMKAWQHSMHWPSTLFCNRLPPPPHAGSKMAMTTPVFSSTDGIMQFVVQPQGQQQQQQVRGQLGG